MTRGFYEQLGVPPDADLDTVKAAYGRAVAHILKRREATVAQQGDPSALDLSRAQVDEAWEVLSDPARRRRYDAMLAVAGDGLQDVDVEGLWTRVAGAMIHPSVAAAARIVDAATTLRMGPLPEPPLPAPAQTGSGARVDEIATAPRAAMGGFGAPRPVGRRPAAADEPPTTPTLATAAPAPLSMPEPTIAPGPPTTPTAVPSAIGVPTADVDQLVDDLGYGGALLAAVRDLHGISLDDMSASTRISARYLEALEREDFESLPSAPAFVRGYVREAARVLGLDVERVVAGYMRRFSDEG